MSPFNWGGVGPPPFPREAWQLFPVTRAASWARPLARHSGPGEREASQGLEDVNNNMPCGKSNR